MSTRDRRDRPGPLGANLAGIAALPMEALIPEAMRQFLEY
jgi:hypothetical protein